MVLLEFLKLHCITALLTLIIGLLYALRIKTKAKEYGMTEEEFYNTVNFKPLFLFVIPLINAVVIVCFMIYLDNLLGKQKSKWLINRLKLSR